MQEKILTALTLEMKDRGLKFTMDDLARRLGISKRTLYEHFSSKEQLITSLLEHSFAEVESKRAEISNNPALDIPTKLQKMLTVRSVVWMEGSEHIVLDIKNQMPKQWQLIKNHTDEQGQMFDYLLQQGIDDGTLRPVFLPAIRTLIAGSISEFANIDFLLTHKTTFYEMMSIIVDIIINGIKNPDFTSSAQGGKHSE